jgi:hypothetical protein
LAAHYHSAAGVRPSHSIPTASVCSAANPTPLLHLEESKTKKKKKKKKKSCYDDDDDDDELHYPQQEFLLLEDSPPREKQLHQCLLLSFPHPITFLPGSPSP